MASEMYRIFCIPLSSAPSKAAKLAGILVTSRLSGDRFQSSTYLMFSASLFHAAQSAVTHLSRATPTRVLTRSSSAASPLPTGEIEAMSDAPLPTIASILDRKCTPLREFDQGGQKANFSHASPLFGEGGGGLFGSRLKRGSLGVRDMDAGPGVPGDCGGMGENSKEISSGGGPAKNMRTLSRSMVTNSTVPFWRSVVPCWERRWCSLDSPL